MELSEHTLELKISAEFRACATRMLLSGLLAIGFFLLTARVTNAVFCVVMAIALIGSLFFVGNGVRLLALLRNRKVSLLPFQKAALALVAVTTVIVVTEMYLAWLEQGKHPEIAALTDLRQKHPAIEIAPEIRQFLTKEAMDNVARRRGVLTLPAEWQRRYTTVPGAKRAEIWHGVLHVYDENNFRRMGPFPPKDPHKFRLLIVGDSMTYGYGVDDKFIYPTLLANALRKNFDVEVLALGVCGAQSEDILKNVRKFLPELKPDLVFYGFVSNDFLPSFKGEYTTRGFEFPIPETLERFLVAHSRFARFVEDGYDATLRAIGLRGDFFDDILKDFAGYQQRFDKDVREMNNFVIANGLPPIVTMVLDQYPDYGGRGYKITQVAERLMKQAGMNVIETEDYYRRFTGYAFYVSLWEGHADEEGHALFASLILPRLEKHPALQRFRKAPSRIQSSL